MHTDFLVNNLYSIQYKRIKILNHTESQTSTFINMALFNIYIHIYIYIQWLSQSTFQIQQINMTLKFIKRSTFTPLASLILKMIKSCETCLSDNSLLLTRDTRLT